MREIFISFSGTALAWNFVDDTTLTPCIIRQFQNCSFVCDISTNDIYHRHGFPTVSMVKSEGLTIRIIKVYLFILPHPLGSGTKLSFESSQIETDLIRCTTGLDGDANLYRHLKVQQVTSIDLTRCG